MNNIHLHVGLSASEPLFCSRVENSADSIIKSLKTKVHVHVADLEENHCVDSSELVLFQTALFLEEEM